MRILIIEDDGGIRESLGDFLVSEGYSIDSADDGYQAIEMLRTFKSRPHLIILDIAMPTMNGFEFRERQLREEVICNIPVICVSAMHWSDWMQDKLGADAYVQKPFDSECLLETIKRFDPRNTGEPPQAASNTPTRNMKII
jgi:DNA-binding response OmpR family regulator